jgi:hypothetical protein
LRSFAVDYAGGGEVRRLELKKIISLFGLKLLLLLLIAIRHGERAQSAGAGAVTAGDGNGGDEQVSRALVNSCRSIVDRHVCRAYTSTLVACTKAHISCSVWLARNKEHGWKDAAGDAQTALSLCRDPTLSQIACGVISQLYSVREEMSDVADD